MSEREREREREYSSYAEFCTRKKLGSFPLLLSLQVVTNIDIQSIEPIDQHMRDSLSKSVQMAIEISTKCVGWLGVDVNYILLFNYRMAQNVEENWEDLANV